MEFAAALQVPDESSYNAGYEKDVAIRTIGDPHTAIAAIRAAAKEISPDLPTDVTLMKVVVGRALRQNRTLAELSSGFGMLTLLLACIGLYGTLAYRVSCRTHEIGVRMALGAQRTDVLRMVIRDGLFIAGTGIPIGIGGALALTQLLRTLLFEITPTDPATYSVVALILIFIALLACYIPARRAMRVDPMVALRYE